VCDYNKKNGLEVAGINHSGYIKNNNCSFNNENGIIIYRSYHQYLSYNTCNKNKANGILCWGSSYNFIENNICESNLENGVRTKFISSIMIDNNNFILNNTCNRNDHYGILANGDNILVKNNTCDNNAEIGILASSGLFVKCSNLTIENNSIENNNVYGIMLYNYINLTINNNKINNNDYNLRIFGITNCSFKNNSISQIINESVSRSTSGLYLYDSDNILIENNFFINNSPGISQSNVVNCTINRNHFINNSKGIIITNLLGSLISNNSFFNSTKGITLGHVRESRIINNTLHFNREVGIRLSDSYNNTFKNCILEQSLRDAIQIEESNNNTFLYCIVDNSINGLNLTNGKNSKNNIFINSTIDNCSEYAILLNESSNLIFLNSSLNQTNIKYLDNASNITIKWYIHAYVINSSKIAKKNVSILVRNNLSKEIYSGVTNSYGYCKWIIVSQYIINKTGIIENFNPYNFSVEKSPYEGFAIPEPTIKDNQIIIIFLRIDEDPPDPPTNLIFNENGGNYLNFSWDESKTFDLKGYNVYINDTNSSFNLLETVYQPYYNATNLFEKTFYHFIIRSFDDAMLESTNLSGKITTIDITPPFPPSSLKLNEIGENYANISWNASISNDVHGYEIYINNTVSNSSFHFINDTKYNYINITNLINETRYFIKIRALDYVPLFSFFSEVLEFLTLDLTQPNPPTALKISNKGGTFNNLTWTPSPSTDVLGYRVYVNNTGSTTNFHYLANTSNTFFNHTGLVQETTYYYKVRAFDEVPLFSSFSNTISTTTLDITPPAPPTDLNFNKYGGKYIHITWTGSSSSDVQGYEIFINDTDSTWSYHYLATTTETYFNHTDLAEETTYLYKVRAFDEVPLYSTFSDFVMVTTLDVTPPVAPTGLEIVNVTGNQIILTWDANTETDLEGFNIYMNASGTGSSGPYYKLHTTTAAITDFVVTGLAEETTFYFKITAFDEVPNESLLSDFVFVKTPDETAPAKPKNLTATPLSGTEIKLTWEANTEPDLEGYNIYINDTPPKFPRHLTSSLLFSVHKDRTSYLVTNLVENTVYYFSITSFDEVPNESGKTSYGPIKTLDDTPPRIPTGLKVVQLIIIKYQQLIILVGNQKFPILSPVQRAITPENRR
jgi:parallel beta-helix repeat protein